MLLCGQNKLELNPLKTVKMAVDLNPQPPSLRPGNILGHTVAAVEMLK